MDNKKIYIYINLKYDYFTQLFLGNTIHLYLLKNNICKNNQIYYKTSLDKLDMSNSLILPIYGTYDSNGYDFDDKISFYKYLGNNSEILGNIKLILTYKNFKCKNKFSKYIVKHRNGIRSQNNFVIKDYLHNVIKKYDPKIYQIQNFINFKYVYGVNCACVNGHIVGIYCYKVKSLLKNDYDVKTLNKIYNYIKNNTVKNFVTQIIKSINYTGFIEFEFLICDKKIYIMECNPRNSGDVITKIYCDEIIYQYIKNYKNDIYSFVSSEYKHKFSKKVLIDFNKKNVLTTIYPDLIKNIISSYFNQKYKKNKLK